MANHIIYRIGALGDTLVALPALHSIKNHFREDKFILLCDKPSKGQRVLASQIFEGTDFFERIITYPSVISQNPLLRLPQILKLWHSIRRTRAKRLTYLAPSGRTASQTKRDLAFFKSAGINEIFATRGFDLPSKKPGYPLPFLPREAEMLLSRISKDGIPIPSAGMGITDLDLNKTDEEKFKKWLSSNKSDLNRPWLAVAPFSNQPAKIWPTERYVAVVKKLIDEYSIWPVVFGSAQESQMARSLISMWGCGFNAAGALEVRPAAVALSRCLLYLGADTGPMHLAATVKVPCVAIFSSRDYPGRWYPYGEGHHVFYKNIECEGCGLTECIDKKMACILSFGESEVFNACQELLKKRLSIA